PASCEAGGENPVIRFWQRRVRITEEGFECRIRRFEKKQVLNPRLNASALPGEPHRACSLFAPPAGEGVRMVAAIDDDSLPRLLDEPDRARRNVREVFHKMAGECLTETLHIRKGMVAGEGVNRVLHRIGRYKL